MRIGWISNATSRGRWPKPDSRRQIFSGPPPPCTGFLLSFGCKLIFPSLLGFFRALRGHRIVTLSLIIITITKLASGGSLLRLIATIPGSSGARGRPRTCFVMGLTVRRKKYLRDFVSKLGLEKPDFGPECSRLLLVKTSPQTPLAL